MEFVGFYLPPLFLWGRAEPLFRFAIIRWLLDRFGLYRFVWHRPLFNLALYVLLVGGALFLGNLAWP